MPIRKLLSLLISAAAAAALFAAPAQGAGFYKILLTEPYEELPKGLQAQIQGFPDVAVVDVASTENTLPTPAQLSAYDVVVSVGDSSYENGLAWSNALADFYDAGGVVVQAGYDTWEGVGSYLEGRFVTGGYSPVIAGDNVNDETSLGVVKTGSPLLEGVTSLTTVDNTAPTLAPGAELIASWLTGNTAIALKGRAVAITAWLGDDYGPGEWSGDYGRVIVNAARALGPQRLNVVNAKPAGGTVTSSVGGISCGTVCSATLPGQTVVALTPRPARNFAFTGFGGDCAGATCALTMTGGSKSVSAGFARYGFGKVAKRDLRNGSVVLQVKSGGPGRVVVSGKRIKVQSRMLAGARTLLVPVVPKGKAVKALDAKGKARVAVRLAFIPAGGKKSVVSRKLNLLKSIN